MATFQAVWKGDRTFADALRGASIRQRQSVVTAAGRAGIRVQEIIRGNLDREVYSSPPSASGYIRTHRLMNSVHASPPDASHDDDHDRALNNDLAARAPSRAAGWDGDNIVSEVGSWVDYADFVHEGVNQPTPTLFVEDAVDEAEDALADEMEKMAVKLTV